MCNIGNNCARVNHQQPLQTCALLETPTWSMYALSIYDYVLYQVIVTRLSG